MSTHPNATPNWLHLDLKGILPSAQRLLAWIDFFADAGFNGVVWEYEDRLPWRTWPGTFRAGYTLEQWRQIWRRCAERGLEVVPLIQTQGHLEWLLKHERWSAWRENGCWNELCPQEPAVMPALEAWLDEVIELHPGVRYLNIGGDETWNVATCPACRAVAAQHPEGKMGVYLDHVQRVAQAAIDRGVRPMIWADMFWREERIDLAAHLPEPTVLIDWQYAGGGPWATVATLGESGRAVWGASAVRSSFDTRQAVAPIGLRLENVLGWHALRREAGGASLGGLIHTTWGRGRSLMPLYGPWEGWLPGFIAAGDPARWPHDPLAPWVSRLDAAMTAESPAVAKALVEELAEVSCEDAWREQCRRWWVLALRHRVAFLSSLGCGLNFAGFEAIHRSIGVDPDTINHSRAARRAVLASLDAWARDVRRFFADNELDGADEFIAGRTEGLRQLLSHDWAAEVIPAREPVSAR